MRRFCVRIFIVLFLAGYVFSTIGWGAREVSSSQRVHGSFFYIFSPSSALYRHSRGEDYENRLLELLCPYVRYLTFRSPPRDVATQNGTVASLQSLVAAFNKAEGTLPKNAEVFIAPPAIHMGHLRSTLRKDFSLAIQNVWSGPKDYGAYTGEVTPAMAKDFGVEWALVGHSERRHVVAHEPDSLLNLKVHASLKAGLKVILCVGETLAQRDAKKAKGTVLAQVAYGVTGLTLADWKNVAIAYEPVWAIGTGRVATPDQAQEMHAWIREWLSTNVDAGVAKSTRIIYGGSVKPANCDALWKKKDVDGFLVGGASLKADFLKIAGCVSSSL